MKVYTVLKNNDYIEYEYFGVFGAKGQAENRIKEIVKEYNVEYEKFYI